MFEMRRMKNRVQDHRGCDSQRAMRPWSWCCLRVEGPCLSEMMICAYVSGPRFSVATSHCIYIEKLACMQMFSMMHEVLCEITVIGAGSGQVSSLSLVLMDFLIVVLQQSSEVVFLSVWTFMQRHSAEETLLFNPRDFVPHSLCFSMCSLCLCQCETMWECPNGPSTASGPREWVGLSRIYSFPHSRALTGPPLISLEWSGSDILQQTLSRLQNLMVKNQDVLAQLISRMEAEKQSGPRSIDNPLSISALAFIDSLAGDKCAAFIWDKH